MTHLADADDLGDPLTPQQVRVILSLAEPGVELSMANSAGVLGWPETHGHWVRPGIMLYGVSPFLNEVGSERGLLPVMTLEARLIARRRLRRGDRVGYGGSYVCPEDMPGGVVAIGYGDGYPRHAPSGTPVLVNGRRVPLIGRVSMDLLVLDLRSQPDAQVGDPVVLWGRGLPVEEIAALAGTIGYELLTGVTRRVRFEHHPGDGGTGR
jgi:alanine racemase